MQHSKEKVPKERGIHPNVALLVIAMTGAAILSIGAITTPAAVFAQERQNDGSGFSEGHGTPRQDPGRPVLDDTSTGPNDPADGTAGVEDPNCWGDVSRQLAQQEDSQPGLGEHASSFGEPRDGVGNQAEDTPAEHGDNVGDMANPDIECIIE
jgi:hypothetical protein